MSGDDLIGRVARLEARAELQELVARYCAAVDDRDLAGIIELFTPDGSFGHEGEDPVTGHEAIREYYLGRLSGVPYSVHYPHTQIITFTDDREATGVVMAHAEMGRVDAPPLRAAMRYYDVYRLHQGHYRFARRRLRFWYMARVDDVDRGSLGSERVQWPVPRRADLPDGLETFAAFESESAMRRGEHP